MLTDISASGKKEGLGALAHADEKLGSRQEMFKA